MDDPNLNPPPAADENKALDEAERLDQLREGLAFDPPPIRPPSDEERAFFGASTSSFHSAVTREVHPMAANHGIASADPPQGGKDEALPVTKGNQHLVLGERVAE